MGLFKSKAKVERKAAFTAAAGQDGLLDLAGLQLALRKIAPSKPPSPSLPHIDDLRALLTRHDTDGDGKLTYIEFKALIVDLSSGSYSRAATPAATSTTTPAAAQAAAAPPPPQAAAPPPQPAPPQPAPPQPAPSQPAPSQPALPQPASPQPALPQPEQVAEVEREESETDRYVRQLAYRDQPAAAAGDGHTAATASSSAIAEAAYAPNYEEREGGAAEGSEANGLAPPPLAPPPLAPPPLAPPPLVPPPLVPPPLAPPTPEGEHAEAKDEAPLPDGWEAVTADDGRIYYWHCNTAEHRTRVTSVLALCSFPFHALSPR